MPLSRSAMNRLQAIYNVVVIPPPLSTGYPYEYRFLVTNNYKIHFSLLCSEGIPLLRESDVPKFCRPDPINSDEGCPLNFWCHVGPNATNLNFCCPKNKKISNRCHLPPNSGFGTSKIIRFWYDWRAGKCRDMVYTGFGGNENNFLSKADCEKACKGTIPPTDSSILAMESETEAIEKNKIELAQPKVTTTTGIPVTNPCNLSPDKGTRGKKQDKSILRWYYDVATEKCIQFHYLGFDGNANNFMNEQSCLDTCGGGKHDISSCLYPMSQGQGSHEIPRHYYNAKTKSCKKFIYKGQSGNMNRFPSRSTCEKVCIKGTTKSMPKNMKSVTSTTQTPMSTSSQQAFSLSSNFLMNLLNFEKELTPAPSATFGHISSGNPTLEFLETLQTTTSPSEINQVPSTQAMIQPTTLQPDFPTLVSMVEQTSAHANYPSTVAPDLIVFPKNTNENQHHGVRKLSPHSYQNQFRNTNLNPDLASLSELLPDLRQMTTQSNGQSKPIPFGPMINAETFLPSNTKIGPISGPTVIGDMGNGHVPMTMNSFPSNPPDKFMIGPNNAIFEIPNLHKNESNGHNTSYFIPFGPIINTATTMPDRDFGQVKPHGHEIDLSPRKCTFFIRQCKTLDLSPCAMNLHRGEGEKAEQRWGYHPKKKNCVNFVYNGEGGNQNNFLTRSDCINTCVAGLNPCSNGFPLVGGNRPLRCSTFGQTCPSEYFCHIGGTDDTTVCCPKTGINPCHLPLATGGGSAILNRYYFDGSSSTCKAFTYTGMNGNENNFLSLTDCRRTCPEYDNPCPSGSPAMNSDGSVHFCTSTNPNCPQGHFCHIGDSRQTTLCCPSTLDGSKMKNSKKYSSRGHFHSMKHHHMDPCTLELKIGNGHSQLPRYFYNPQTRSCQSFAYSGKGGNENNFVSKTECELACPVLDSPCSHGFPALDTGGEPILCSTALQNMCPAGFFCHIGSTSATTLCCPGAGDPCRMPMSKGNGNSVLNRWYFNEESRVCVSFVYSGRGGNQNNFISRQDCLNACPEYTSPCPEGQPHIGLSGQITHCGGTNPSICPTTFWCHVGATLDTSVCCPGAADPCDQEVEVGTGNSQLLRYHYDQMSRSCKQFRYTGIGGNENNFLTLAVCESRCPVFRNPCALGPPQMDDGESPVTCSAADDSTCHEGYFCHIGANEQSTICCSGAVEDICSEPRVPGNGSSSLPRYYYNYLTKQCLPFIYTGIGGNQNNFLSKAACESTCEVMENPCANGDPATGSHGQYVTCSSSTPNVCPSGYWCHIGIDVSASVCCPGADNPCALVAAPGTGRSSVTRWYFDSNLRRCTRFTYSGKGGNSNNFVTLQECQSRCPEFLNPCAAGDPAQAPGGGILFCSPHQQTCPSSYWCHIGATHESTVCCPSLGDPCLSAMTPGTGTAKLPRWYYNQNSRQCLQFTYTGSSGNSNNFLNEQDCAARCPVFINPCPNVMAHNHLEVTKCSAQSPHSCPSGYWCHIGGAPDLDMSVCCPGASDPCQLPLQQGISHGIGPFTRWYYDLVTRSCKPFQYTGVGGNENNFLTKEDCVQRCPEFINPCFNGEPYREAHTGLTRYCMANSEMDCPNGYYCHVGSSPQTTVCCPGGDKKPCSMPMAVGTGTESLPRWYFNRHTRSCQQFTYSGLTGNHNNFVSKEACAKSCTEFNNPCGNGQPLMTQDGSITYCSAVNPYICPVDYFCHVGNGPETTVCCPGGMNLYVTKTYLATNPCQLPMNVGTGSASLPRFYFNQIGRKCQQFAYTGQSGNANNFISLEACRQACPEFNNPCVGGEPFHMIDGGVFHCDLASPCPPNFYCHFGIDTTTTVCCPAFGGKRPCSMSVATGFGKATLNRYYFNTELQQCVPFIYTGLGGNQNNFLSLHDCVQICIGVSPLRCRSILICTIADHSEYM